MSRKIVIEDPDDVTPGRICLGERRLLDLRIDARGYKSWPVKTRTIALTSRAPRWSGERVSIKTKCSGTGDLD